MIFLAQSTVTSCTETAYSWEVNDLQALPGRVSPKCAGASRVLSAVWGHARSGSSCSVCELHLVCYGVLVMSATALPQPSSMDPNSHEVQTHTVCDKLDVLKLEPVPKNVRQRWMLPRTLCHGLVIFTLGMTVAMRGPAFIDLQLISGADVEEGSYYFAANALGYVVGALCTGWIYSRVKVKNWLIIAPMLVSAILLAATPWCANFVLMLIVNGAVALFWGIYETTINAEEVKGWEGSSHTAMQFLSFSYSVGGIVGPLIVEPFLAPKMPDVAVNSSSSRYVNLTPPSSIDNSLNILSHTDTSSLVILSLQQNGWNDSEDIFYQLIDPRNKSNSLQNSSFHTNGDAFLALKSNIHIAYFIGGLLVVLCCIPLCIVHFLSWRHLSVQTTKDVSDDNNQRKVPLRTYVIVTLSISMFYFFYTGTDDPYSMYLSIFVVTHLGWSKEDGAIASSVFWGCSTVAKLIMVLVVRFVSATVVLLLSLMGMFALMVVLTVSAHFHVHWMIWVCTTGIALCQAAVFGGGVSWADANLLRLDGRAISCIMIFSSLGVMVTPLALGAAMKEFSPMSFPFTMVVESFLTFSIFVFMLVVLKPYMTATYGHPRTQDADISKPEQLEHLFEHELKMNSSKSTISL